MFTTYILKSDKLDTYYIGYTGDVSARIAKHNSGGSRWTRGGMPWKIVFTRDFVSKREAIKFERHLKKMKSRRIIELYISDIRR